MGYHCTVDSAFFPPSSSSAPNSPTFFLAFSRYKKITDKIVPREFSPFFVRAKKRTTSTSNLYLIIILIIYGKDDRTHVIIKKRDDIRH